MKAIILASFTTVLLLLTLFFIFGNRDKKMQPALNGAAQLQHFASVAGKAQGRLLFQEHCAPCHSLHKTHEMFIGPFFNNSNSPDLNYLRLYLQNSKSLKESGNIQARRWDNIFPENAFEHQFKDRFSDRDFTNLIAWLEETTSRK